MRFPMAAINIASDLHRRNFRQAHRRARAQKPDLPFRGSMTRLARSKSLPVTALT